MVNTKSNCIGEPTTTPEMSKESCDLKPEYTNKSAVTCSFNFLSQSIANNYKRFRKERFNARSAENTRIMKNKACDKNCDFPKRYTKYSVYNYDQFSCQCDLKFLTNADIIEREYQHKIGGHAKKETKRRNLCLRRIQSFFHSPFNVFNKNFINKEQTQYTKPNNTVPVKSWADLRVSSGSQIIS